MKHRAPERLGDMNSLETQEMMVSNLALKPLDHPAEHFYGQLMALCRVLGFTFHFYSQKQTIMKRRECQDLQLRANLVLTGGSCLLHLRETSSRCSQGATSRDGTSMGPNRAQRWWDTKEHNHTGGMGRSVYKQGESCSKHC